METEDDILDLIRDLPEEINDVGTTTEMKFLTVGGVLWACYDEIKRLRAENKRLKDGEGIKAKAVRRVSKTVRKS
ncbi:MAG: hypothetical protein ACO3NK_03450 [Prochlorotrichaceae cyanobacterium]|jgi:hypothetical protein